MCPEAGGSESPKNEAPPSGKNYIIPSLRRGVARMRIRARAPNGWIIYLLEERERGCSETNGISPCANFNTDLGRVNHFMASTINYLRRHVSESAPSADSNPRLQLILKAQRLL